MTSHLSLGEFEQTVLLATLHRADSAGTPYGASILEELQERTGRRVSRGALYVTLDRLEAKGLVRSRLEGPTPARGGRRRRYVEVTRAGLRALSASRATLLSLWQGLEDRLQEP